MKKPMTGALLVIRAQQEIALIFSSFAVVELPLLLNPVPCGFFSVPVGVNIADHFIAQGLHHKYRLASSRSKLMGRLNQQATHVALWLEPPGNSSHLPPFMQLAYGEK